MKSLNERVLLNLLTELNMAKAKESELKRSNLATDKIEQRIDTLNAAIRQHQQSMIEDSLKENRNE